MYALIKFSDETYYVCKISRLALLSRTLCAKKEKSTGIHHQIQIIVRHPNVEHLNTLKKNLERGIPKISLHDIIKSKDRNKTYDNVENISVVLSDVDKENSENQNNSKDIITIVSNIDKNNENDDIKNNNKKDDTNIAAVVLSDTAKKIEESESNDDSEYYPSNESYSESCSDDDANDEDENDKYKKPPNKSNTSLEINKSVEVPAARVLDDKDLYIATSSSSNKDKKKNCCFFCKKLYTKIARHLETIHSNEAEVKKFSLLPKKCAERLKIIDTIRRKGNFQYNTDSNTGKGDLIVCRRPQASKKKEVKDYLPCAKCHGFFSKISLRQHFYRCTGRNSKHARAVTILGRAILGRVHSAANRKLRSVILPVIREDDVYRVIRYDKLIILYGNKLFIKYKLEHQHDMIRAHLRLLGRFLLAIKESNNNIIDFESIYHPKFYEDVINTVNKVAGLDDKVGIYSKPTTAAMLGTLIKKVGHIFITECIKRQDDEKKALVKDFLELLTEDYGTSVNKTVIETRLQHQRQKNDDLPSMDDIAKLYMYLKCKRQKAFDDLTNEYVYEIWLTLAECTLTSVQLFNRKRAGEIERMFIADFEQYKGIDPYTTDDLFKKISLKAQEAAKKYVRFVIRGKLGRTVPVILNNSLLECIKLILQFREKAKVPAENPYIFGLPSYNRKRFKYLRACILMRKFSEDCNAKVAHLLRGTKLRKHIATFCASIFFSESNIKCILDVFGYLIIYIFTIL